MDIPRPHSATRTYRKDIDGLRALAVIAVLLDHFGFRFFTGGYVGVDIFFVISGYLISATILTELRTGTFRIANFYERRIRRILPALFFVLAVATVAAYFILLPDDLLQYAKSLAAAISSTSNLLFWKQAGYFDAESVAKPLLHTWSLGVEEQFYLFFPLLLLALWRWQRRQLRLWIYGMATASFLAAALCTYRAPATAFYLLPFRAWELLIGTILSQGYVWIPRKATGRNLLSIAGLVLLLIPICSYDRSTSFPGLAALLPCVGSALLIAAGESGPSLVGRILAWRPIAFIGLISYSLYLWHWPIMVLHRLATLSLSPSRSTNLALIALSLFAATITWRCIEVPFRHGKWRPERTALFQTAATAALVLSVAAFYLIHSGGAPARFDKRVNEMASYSYTSDRDWRTGTCFLTQENRFSQFNQSACLQQKPSANDYLLYGDSVAASLYPGLKTAFPDAHFSFAASSACRPLKNIEVNTIPMFRRNCEEMSRFMYGNYLPSGAPTKVLLAALWTWEDLPELGQDIEWMKQQGIEVTVIGPIIQYDLPFPKLYAWSLAHHDPAAVARHQIMDRNLDRTMQALARSTWHVPYISIIQDLCDQNPTHAGPCPLFAGQGVPLIFDAHHFTPQGSAALARQIRDLHQNL